MERKLLLNNMELVEHHGNSIVIRYTGNDGVLKFLHLQRLKSEWTTEKIPDMEYLRDDSGCIHYCSVCKYDFYGEAGRMLLIGYFILIPTKWYLGYTTSGNTPGYTVNRWGNIPDRFNQTTMFEAISFLVYSDRICRHGEG